MQSLYTIHAVALDSGSPHKSATALVVVDVIDMDDEQPTFLQTHYTFVLHENEPIQTEVGQVKAVDRDSDDFNDFHFELRLDELSKSKFAINRMTGMIYSEVSFDREETSLYTFTVLAISAGIKPTTSSSTVTVYIADTNDHRPQVQFPNTQNDTVYISSSLPQGEAVTQIQASDMDTGSNAYLTYSIQSGESKDLFVMDTSSGFIFVGGDISTELEYEIHTLNIRIQDGGVPPKSVNTILNIVVNRSNLFTGDKLVVNENLTIVIVIACMSGLLVVVLLVAIAAIIRQQRVKQRKQSNINHVLQHHSVTIEPSDPEKHDMAMDNQNNDKLAESRGYSKKKNNASYKNNLHKMEEGEKEDADGKRKKGVSFAVAEKQKYDFADETMRPLTIQVSCFSFIFVLFIIGLKTFFSFDCSTFNREIA